MILMVCIKITQQTMHQSSPIEGGTYQLRAKIARDARSQAQIWEELGTEVHNIIILTNLGLVEGKLLRIHHIHEALPQRIRIVPPPVHERHAPIGRGGHDLIEHGMIPTPGQAE